MNETLLFKNGRTSWDSVYDYENLFKKPVTQKQTKLYGEKNVVNILRVNSEETIILYSMTFAEVSSKNLHSKDRPELLHMINFAHVEFGFVKLRKSRNILCKNFAKMNCLKFG